MRRTPGSRCLETYAVCDTSAAELLKVTRQVPGLQTADAHSGWIASTFDVDVLGIAFLGLTMPFSGTSQHCALLWVHIHQKQSSGRHSAALQAALALSTMLHPTHFKRQLLRFKRMNSKNAASSCCKHQLHHFR